MSLGIAYMALVEDLTDLRWASMAPGWEPKAPGWASTLDSFETMSLRGFRVSIHGSRICTGPKLASVAPKWAFLIPGWVFIIPEWVSEPPNFQNEPPWPQSEPLWPNIQWALCDSRESLFKFTVSLHAFSWATMIPGSVFTSRGWASALLDLEYYYSKGILLDWNNILLITL